ncbi:MAG TPA: non-heme iron oxygenase ferredoxin subunit [Xanthobacteraceae bacterium]|nr:non-heme iron oxygenase ferredoxin subunit [Xanthobacteraceae bacterium]
MAKHVVAAARDLPPGSRKRFEVAGRSITIFNVAGEFFALLDRCPHQGGSLCEGQLIGLLEADGPGRYRYTRRGEIVRCPWHGWEFDLRTGRSYCEPARVRTKTYEVVMKDGRELVEGPYLAETFPVRVEEQYVVVEV